jgi:hypothetical protein
MGNVEFGRCDVCLKDGPLVRTYWHYPIACECHGPTHHEMRIHCDTCVPQTPLYTQITVSTAKLLDPIHEGLFKNVIDE